jgi:nucleotide-binding universal stress UspA family protein
MAKQLSVPVTLFHALDIDRHAEFIAAADLEIVHVRTKQRMETFLPTETDISNVRLELADGPAAECIVEEAAKMQTPLIMMPTRGHTRFRQLLLGSVTAAVLHDATCPVWTDAHTEAESTNGSLYRSVTCAIDMGRKTPDVLRTAVEFSVKFEAALHIVHSVSGVDPRFPSGTANRAHRFLVEKAREDFQGHCSKVGLNASLEIVEDVGLVNGVVGFASTHGADLLIIGRGVIQGSLGRLRTNAHELIRRAPCPVLSV